MGRKSNKKRKGAEESSESAGAKVDRQSSAASQDGAAVKHKMKRKQYEKEMRVLHGELVAMQEWVKATGAKVCIVFEGRDTAGKGGTIKRITERVSPRVFRVVALRSCCERDLSGQEEGMRPPDE